MEEEDYFVYQKKLWKNNEKSICWERKKDSSNGIDDKRKILSGVS